MTIKAFCLAAIFAVAPAVLHAQDTRPAVPPLTVTSPPQAVEAALTVSPALRGAGAARQAGSKARSSTEPTCVATTGRSTLGPPLAGWRDACNAAPSEKRGVE